MYAQEDLNYPVSLVPPDISSYRVGNTGVEYIHQLDSGMPGPHVMISSVVPVSYTHLTLPTICSV